VHRGRKAEISTKPTDTSAVFGGGKDPPRTRIRAAYVSTARTPLPAAIILLGITHLGHAEEQQLGTIIRSSSNDRQSARGVRTA
jgi:hypothetical protein